jgi:hypothetical protein
MSVAEEELSAEQLADVRKFTGQITKFGCALLPVLSEEEVEAEVYAVARPTWVKVCRGDPKLEAAYPKFAMAIAEILEILFAANRAVGRAVGE